MHQLTGLDAAFLAMETSAVYGHVGSICVLDPSTAPQPLTLERLQELVASRLHLVPPFRRRLAEVRTTLEVSVTIYVLLTKADLLAGFTEYFDDLDFEGRRAVLGSTLPFSTAKPDAGALAAGILDREFRAKARQHPLGVIARGDRLDHGCDASVADAQRVAAHRPAGLEKGALAREEAPVSAVWVQGPEHQLIDLVTQLCRQREETRHSILLLGLRSHSFNFLFERWRWSVGARARWW